MRLNSHVGTVRMQMTNTQNMNNYDTGTQNTHNLHVCSMENRESKGIKQEERNSKRVIANACYLGEIEPKSVHISVNASEVKDATNETKDEEPLVTETSDINAPIYLKQFECGKNY